MVEIDKAVESALGAGEIEGVRGWSVRVIEVLLANIGHVCPGIDEGELGRVREGLRRAAGLLDEALELRGRGGDFRSRLEEFAKTMRMLKLGLLLSLAER